MHLPATTGYVALWLDTTEPRLNDMIRRGKIVPPPPVMLGRRLWDLQSVLQAAKHLGVAVPVELRSVCGDERGGGHA